MPLKVSAVTSTCTNFTWGSGESGQGAATPRFLLLRHCSAGTAMSGKDFLVKRAGAQNIALRDRGEARRARLRRCASDGTFEFETHFLGKLVDAAHLAFGFAWETRNLQRQFAGKQQGRHCAFELISQRSL